MSIKRKGPDKYHFETRINGRRYRKTVKAPGLKEARAAFKLWFEHLCDPGKRSLFEIIESYVDHVSPGLDDKGRKHLSRQADLIRDYFGDRPLRAITRGDVEGFLSWRRSHRLEGKGPLAPATLNRSLSVLSCIFNHAIRRGWYDKANPCTLCKLREKNIRDVWLSGEQIGAILSSARGGPLETCVLMAIGAGLRKGEILSLEWSDVDLDRGVLTVRPENAKGKKGRRVPLPRFVLDHLSVMDRQVSRVVGRYTEHRLRGEWERLRDRLSLPGLTFHDLRHQFGQVLRAVGVSMNDISLLLGHSAVSVTERVYAQSGAFNLSEKVQKLDVLFKQWARNGPEEGKSLQ